MENNLTKTDKVKNIICFLCIIFQDSQHLLEALLQINPDYLIEKYERYILSDKVQHSWGLHPTIRRSVFEMYCREHGLPTDQYNEID